MILKGYLFGICYAVVCLLLSLILYKLGLPKKYTRKVVHILVGFEWVILYHYMGAGVHFLSVCILFLLLLTIAYKGKLMPMISSEGDNAPGTVYYAAAMTGVAAVGCFVPEVMLPFGIGVMCTSVGDGFAGVVGQSIKRWNPKIFGNKTLFGTAANVVLSSLSALVISSIYSLEIGIASCLLIGILSAELEMVTPYGLDNITVTWGTTALAYLFVDFPNVGAYLLPILFTPIVVMFAISKKALTTSGIIAALLLDLAVTIAFGNSGFVILCVFFIGSIIVDKIKKRHKNSGRKEKEAKGDCRDYMQVIANGMPSFVTAVAFVITKNPIFAVSFIASMAEAFADTAASGIGVFSKNTYDLFKLRKCEQGLSGGMSVIGTVASLAAACLVGGIACLLDFDCFGFTSFFIVVISAFLGAVIDSLLGSLLQVKLRCTVCGEITEKAEHCGAATVIHSGIAVIDNDVVNLISSTSASLIAIFLAILI